MGENIRSNESIGTDIFANAFRDSGIGMALVSQAGKFLDANDALCSITEYSRQELLNLTFQEITHPDDLALDLKFVQRLLNREIDTYNLEKRYISKNRKIIWIILTVSVARNNEGTPEFYIAQVIDITKKKQLADEIHAKNSELEATKISLINKINQLEEFSYIVAHNMRGPVGNIKMFSEELSKANLDPDSAMQCGVFTYNEAVSAINQSSTALMETLEELMTIAQVKLSADVPHDECDIAQIVERVTSHLSGTIYEKNADIQLNLAIRSVSYPHAYLENIFYNLISNALKYSCNHRLPKIIITTQKEGMHTIISIKDNGLGIDLEKYGDRIFKMNQVFHQGFDSKGVGLFLIKTQIESLNGRISVKSAANQGAEFTIRL